MTGSLWKAGLACATLATALCVTDTVAADNKHSNDDKVEMLTPRIDDPHNIDRRRTGIRVSGMPIVIGPYFGTDVNFSGYHLFTFSPSINEDRDLLQHRQREELTLKQAGHPLVRHPLLKVSGKLEGGATYISANNQADRSDIDLNTAELDFLVDVNRYVTGFFNIEYDNAQSGANRIGSSNIALNKGFITLGNLNESPVYFTIGQIFLPFGQFSSNLISSPLNVPLARIKSRAVVLGYAPQEGEGIYAAVSAGRGSSFIGSGGKVNQFTGNVEYIFTNDWLFADVAVSAASNIADAKSFQSNGLPTVVPGVFSGFSNAAASEKLSHVVPALDVRAKVSAANFTAIAEYDVAVRRFAVADLSFNGKGARPAALHVEGSYRTTLLGKPAQAAVAYDQTFQALALNLPKRRYGAAASTSLFRDTIQSIELLHERPYSKSDIASGQGAATATTRASTTFANAVTTLRVQFGLYF